MKSKITRYIYFFICFFILTTLLKAQSNNYFYYNNEKKIILKPSGDKYLVKFRNDSTNIDHFTSQNIVMEKHKDFYVTKFTNKDTSQLNKFNGESNIEFAVPIFILDNGKEESVLNQFVVKLRQGVSLEQIAELNRINGVKVIKSLDGIEKKNRFLLGLNENKNIFNIVNIYNNNELVDYASPDIVLFNPCNSVTPNDQYFPNQWGLSKINAPLAWDITTGSSNIVVAVLDDGVDLTHEDLTGKFVQGYDFIDNDNTPQPGGNGDIYHGTACAGLIAANANNNNLGICGVSWGAKIMPIRIMQNDSYVNYSTVAQGVIWAKEHNADILNNSYGGSSPSTDLTNAINDAATTGRSGKGCIIVCSAGNDNTDVSYPAYLDNAIAVGATNENDVRWTYSNTGSSLDVVAPSGQSGGGNGNIYTTDIMGAGGATSGNYYFHFGGTSAAAPLVSGLAALILSIDPSMTRSQVTKVIEYSTVDLGPAGFDNDYGYGRIDAYKALDAISHKTTNGSLVRDETWFNTVNLTGTVSVPSGVKLTIISDATVNLNGYSITSTGGTINLETGATINGLRAKLTSSGTLKGLCGTVQAAINAAPDFTGCEIDLSDGSFTEYISIVNKCLSIIGGPNLTTLSGIISASNCDYLNLIGFTGNNQTISLSGCYCPSLYNVNIVSGTNQCIYAYNCEYLHISMVDISDRYAYTFGTGLFVNQSWGPTIDGTLGFTFFNHNGRGIVVNGSTLTLNNVYFCSNVNDFVTGTGGMVEAYNCWFPGGNASTQGSDIYLSGNQNFTNCSGLYKAGGSVVNAPAGGTDSLSNEFRQINNTDFDIAAKIRADISAGKQFDKGKYRDDYLSLADNYTGFINKHPASEYSNTALTSIVHIYKALGDYDGMKTCLQAVLADNKLKAESGLAKRFMIDYYSGQKDFTTAIKTADEILAGKDTNYICDALYAKGYIYSHDLNNQDEAVKSFSDIIINHSYNSLVTLAKNELQFLGVDAEKISAKNTDVNNSLEISTGNYPNPFNPSTIISYQLPKDGFVILKVYDELGREVKTLVSEYKIQGKYEITFNASGLASGVYFYQLRVSDPSGKANNSVVTKKILLMK
jgi:subtilisin family serine protease/tetratricopeptide (TPR) repeat protein